MYYKIAAFLTVKLDSSFVCPVTPKTADRALEQFESLGEFVLSELQQHGAIRTNHILDVVQAVFDLEGDTTRAEIFGRTVKLVRNFQMEIGKRYQDHSKKRVWGGLAVGAVIFDDQMLFGDAVTDSVTFSEAACNENAALVASGELVPDHFGDYRLSRIGARSVVVLKELPSS